MEIDGVAPYDWSVNSCFSIHLWDISMLVFASRVLMIGYTTGKACICVTLRVYEQTKHYHKIEKTLTDGRGLAVSVVAKLTENFHEYS